ncbi:MAG: ribonuclease D [Methyloceanibacter sp.]|uniref:ribonuclease D n=1 Tax=Methyloceanibacter sp. TaxID=1965321 RepID=UPI003D6D62AC
MSAKTIETPLSQRQTVELHKGDLPAGRFAAKSIAIDTETLGLNPFRDRLCLVQLSDGDGTAALVQFSGTYDAPELNRLLTDESILKIFHFGRFDIAVLKHFLGVMPRPVYCTKIASKLARTFTDKHSLKDLCRELLGVELSKQQQSSDWGAAELTQEQLNYAASDVLYLHALRDRLDVMLRREGRERLAKACFDFLPTRAELDLEGWSEIDPFAH